MATRSSRDLDERARAVLPLTPIVMHILLALVDENRHGLGIASHVEAFSGGRVVLGPGTLYGAIKRLLELGLVDDVDDGAEGQSTDPRRRYYCLTSLGRRALEIETRQLATVLNVARLKRVLR
jgi:DNA-binding PadR family transcriptional regulator